MRLNTLYEDVMLEVIRKIGPKKWRVYSHKGKNLGTYGSREGAKKRLKQVEFFKHKKG